MSSTDKNVYSLEKQTNPELVPLLDRAYLYLEMGDFAKAAEMCEAALNKDSRNSHAYTYLLMTQLGIKKIEELGDSSVDYRQNNNYQMALRFADDEQKAFLEECAEASGNRGIVQAKDDQYNQAVSKMISATTAKDFDEVIRLFDSLGDWRDSVNLANNCRAKQAEFREKESAAAAKKQKRNVVILSSLIAAVVLIAVLLITVLPMINSDSGSNVPQNDTPEKAEHNSGSDSSEKDEPEDTEEIDPEESKYNEALECIENGKHAEAYQAFTELGDYKDSKAYLEKFVFVYDKVTEYKKGEVCSTREYTYDSNGNVLKESGKYADGQTYTIEYTYDSNGNVLKESKNKSTTEYTYDDNGKLLKTKYITPYRTNVTEYTYDSNGNLAKSVKDGEYIIEYTCDNNGNIIEKKDDSSVTSYTYDANGNLEEKYIRYHSDNYEYTSYTYDDYGRLVSEYTGFDDYYFQPNYSIDYTYDSNGNITQEVSKQYDEYFSVSLVNTFEYTYEGENVFYKG